MTYYDFNRLERNSHTFVFPAGAVGRNRMVRYFGCGHNRMKIEPPTEKSPIENCVTWFDEFPYWGGQNLWPKLRLLGDQIRIREIYVHLSLPMGVSNLDLHQDSCGYPISSEAFDEVAKVNMVQLSWGVRIFLVKELHHLFRWNSRIKMRRVLSTPAAFFFPCWHSVWLWVLPTKGVLT